MEATQHSLFTLDNPAVRVDEITQEVILILNKDDRVTRRNINAFRYMQGINGTVVEVLPNNRCKVKWDYKNPTGQEHSTLQTKYLRLL